MVGCPFSIRAKRRALVIAVWLLLPGGVGDHAGAMASGNCRIFETSLRAEICSDPQLASEATRLKDIYESLKKSPAQSVAFLANADESAFIISLNDCRNSPSIETPPLSTPGCAAKRLEEKLATMSQRSDSTKLIGELRKEKFLSLALLPAYGPQFVGVVANWFGDLRLSKKAGNVLQGTLSDGRGTSHFPAILEKPNTLDTIFFGEGGCSSGCASWWKGQFVIRGGALVFQLIEHRA